MQPFYETPAEKKKATMAKKLAELKNIKDKNTHVNAGSGKKKDKSKKTDNAVTSVMPSTTSTATSGSKNRVKTTSLSTISKPLDKYRIPKKSDSSAKLAKETDDAIVVKKVTKAATNSSKVNRSTVLNKGKRCGEEITGATVTKKDCKVPTSKVTPTSTDLGKRKETKIQQKEKSTAAIRSADVKMKKKKEAKKAETSLWSSDLSSSGTVINCCFNGSLNLWKPNWCVDYIL